MSNSRLRKVAVVGGGMTGLAAAFYLYRQAAAQGVPIAVTLLERSGRLGGRVNTLRRDGFHIERGPDSFLARKMPMVQLAEDLGLSSELTGTNPQAKKTYIARDGVLHPIPAGLVLGVPTNVETFLESGLLSEAGKRRALAETDIPASPADGPDESVGAFLERRFGPEMVDRIFEPLLSGIYAGDLYALSLEATFPQFRIMEQTYGSVIRGTIEMQKAANAPRDRSIGSVFLTFKTGLSAVIEALEAQLRAQGCDIHLGTQVVALSKREEAAGYLVQLEDGSRMEADAIVVALPAAGIADLLVAHADVSAMRNIHYISVANVVFGYDETGFNHPLDGSGFLVPRGENSLITASTWTSAKWLHTAPRGKRLIRCYVGRAGEEANVDLSDGEITSGVRNDLQRFMGLTAEPAFVEITRLHRSMPQYPPGHKEAIAAFLAQVESRLPGIVPAGQPFGGVGLPDCVAQGRSAAEKLVRLFISGYNETDGNP
jgi:oxygen-dependent protoporphyrinogen oxidase